MTYLKHSKRKLSNKNSVSAKLSFKNEEESKTFSDKQKLKEFTSNRYFLQEISLGGNDEILESN